MKFCNPILSCKDADAFERDLLGGDELGIWRAVEKAGALMAEEFIREFANYAFAGGAPKIFALVGKGNNGADAIVMMAGIAKIYKNAQFFLLAPNGEESFNACCRRGLKMLSALSSEIKITADVSRAADVYPKRFDAIIEGLVGMNFTPPLKETHARALRYVNALTAKVRATIDIPAGLSDEPAKGEDIFRADVTYSAGTAKKAVFLPQNRPYVGRVRYIDLGMFDGSAANYPAHEFVVRRDAMNFLNTLRSAVTDKRSYGHLFIFAGSKSYPGAALLNVKAALKAGAGLVTAFVPESFAPSFAAVEPSAIWVSCPEDENGALSLETLALFNERKARATAILAGSGITQSPEAHALLLEIAKTAECPVVLDADGITPILTQALYGKKNCLITPHVGEFLRLSKTADDEALLAFSKNLTTLLKSNISAVSDGVNLVRSVRGCPTLARGGSGDILSGLCGALISRADLNLSALEAACVGAQWLGLAAERAFAACGENAVNSSDIPNRFLEEALHA